MLHKFSKYFLSKSNFCETGIAKKGNDRHTRLIPAKIWSKFRPKLAKKSSQNYGKISKISAKISSKIGQN